MVGPVLRSYQKGTSFAVVGGRGRMIAVEGMEAQIVLWKERQREKRMTLALMVGEVKRRLFELVQMELVLRILLVVEKYMEQADICGSPRLGSNPDKSFDPEDVSA